VLTVIHAPGVDDLKDLIHDAVGPDARVRSWDLLESAIAAPFLTFDGVYLHQDLFTMGAVLLRSLSENQALIDGNKRLAWSAAVFFFRANGYAINASVDDVVKLMLGIASHTISVPLIAEFLRANRRSST